MKQRLLKAIVATLILGGALGCGPGNGSKPYEGNSYLSIRASETNVNFTSDGVVFWYQGLMTVYEYKLKWNDSTGTYDIDNSAPAIPVPNIKVDVCFDITEFTLQNYADLAADPIVLYGDESGEIVRGASGCLEYQTNFNGQIRPRIYVPAKFDGKVTLTGYLVADSTTVTLNLRFEAGTQCTDREDNDDDGFVDRADANCAGNPYGNE